VIDARQRSAATSAVAQTPLAATDVGPAVQRGDAASAIRYQPRTASLAGHAPATCPHGSPAGKQSATHTRAQHAETFIGHDQSPTGPAKRDPGIGQLHISDGRRRLPERGPGAPTRNHRQRRTSARRTAGGCQPFEADRSAVVRTAWRHCRPRAFGISAREGQEIDAACATTTCATLLWLPARIERLSGCGSPSSPAPRWAGCRSLGDGAVTSRRPGRCGSVAVSQPRPFLSRVRTPYARLGLAGRGSRPWTLDLDPVIQDAAAVVASPAAT
jgi:hypothetical protein